MATREPKHRYEAIAGEIRLAIGKGAYEPDGRLPSERRLVRAFGAQRNTVRQALGVLEGEGRIASVDKSGWYVVPAHKAADASLGDARVLLLSCRHRLSPTLDSVMVGMREALDEHGVEALRYDLPGKEGSRYIVSVDEVLEFGAQGLVLWPNWHLDTSLLSRLQSAAPLVLLDRRAFGFASDCVLFDDYGGAKAATAHLVENGHRRIAFYSDSPFVESVQSRWRGYRDALDAAGIVPDNRLTVLTNGLHQPMLRETLRVLTGEMPEPPTAVVCSNDVVASSLLLFLRSEGIGVPDDLAVVGFGNGNPDYLDLMGLTSVDQSFEAMGRAAGGLLVERLRRPSASQGEHRRIDVPVHVVARTSSGSHLMR